MAWYILMTIIAFAFCLIFYAYYLIKIIRTSKADDFAKKSGSKNKAIAYSMTAAMNPSKKESAYMHLPTYTAGLLYHGGTFLSIIIFLLYILQIQTSKNIHLSLAVLLVASSSAGFGILVKRILNTSMKALSNTDDYLSNILVSSFQFFTAISLIFINFLPYYYVLTTFLLLYLPFGKLRHSIFFFAARYHLGVFYGNRNVWPPVKN